MPLWQFSFGGPLRQEIAPEVVYLRDRLPQYHDVVHHQADMTSLRP
jgi:hypothetical protein